MPPPSVSTAATIPRCLAVPALLLAAALAMPGAAHAQLSAVPQSGENLPASIVAAFDKLFGGPYAGRRAVHANGLLCEGSFVPAVGAAALSRAVHFRGAALPVLVRFSNFAAMPGLPDGNPLASPRGMAIKFLLPDGNDTDIVVHSFDGFPASTPAEFLEFLRALPDLTATEAYAARHAAARAFLDDPKPAPSSYGTETYFGVNTFRFTNAAGLSQYGRYRIVPVAGSRHLSAADAAGRAPDYLTTELAERLGRGPIEFRVLVQLSAEGDVVEDGSISWPGDRPVVELGTLALQALIPAGDERQTDLAFKPTNLVGGIEPSADPMLLARTQAYRISAERRADAH